MLWMCLIVMVLIGVKYEQSLNDIDLDEIEFRNEIQPDYLSDRESDRDGGIVNM